MSINPVVKQQGSHGIDIDTTNEALFKLSKIRVEKESWAG